MSRAESLQFYAQQPLFEHPTETALDKDYSFFNPDNIDRERALDFKTAINRGDLLEKHPWLLSDETFQHYAIEQIDHLCEAGGIFVEMAIGTTHKLGAHGVEGANNLSEALADEFMQRNVGYLKAMYSGFMKEGDLGEFTEADVKGFRFKYLMSAGMMYSRVMEMHPETVKPHIASYADVLQKFALEWPTDVVFNLTRRFPDAGPAVSATALDYETKRHYVRQNKKRFIEECKEEQEPDSYDGAQSMSRLKFGAETGLLTIEDIDWYVATVVNNGNQAQLALLPSEIRAIAKSGVYFADAGGYTFDAANRGVLGEKEAAWLCGKIGQRPYEPWPPYQDSLLD